jgi:hypothetical protein
MFPPDNRAQGPSSAVPQPDGPLFLNLDISPLVVICVCSTGQLTIVTRTRAINRFGSDGLRREIPADADYEIAEADAAANWVRSPFDCSSFGTVTIYLPWRIDATPSGLNVDS